MDKDVNLAYIRNPCDLSNLCSWYLEECKSIIDPLERSIAQCVGSNIEIFFRWPERAELLWDGCDRARQEKGKQRYHQYLPDIKAKAKALKITLDSRSNGPAIAAYLMAGGDRPGRYTGNNKWSVHHIYNNKFPYIGRISTLHAVKEGKHFTHSAGLVAIHPIADQMCDEYPFMAWLLRAESYNRFGYDPDGVFYKVKPECTNIVAEANA